MDQIKSALMADGPLMIGVYANTAFNFYSSGVYSGCPTDAVNYINHAILLIGWTQNGWIAKNQWGTTWGDKGYIELDFVKDCGMRYLMGSVKVSSMISNPQVVMDPQYNTSSSGGSPSPTPSIVPQSTTGNWEGYTIISMLVLTLFLLL